jgi:hypothetical protein
MNVLKRIFIKGVFRLSVYADQIERFLEYFTMDQMHFIIFEEFIENPDKGLNDLSEFLGITSTNFTQKPLVSNKGYKPLCIPAEYYAPNGLAMGLFIR